MTKNTAARVALIGIGMLGIAVGVAADEMVIATFGGSFAAETKAC
jgi:hypothetical protein